jgi:MFS transporter, putative metabolite:H+ symporter
LSARADLTSVLRQGRAAWAFAGGCVAVTAGVLLHIPMWWMSRSMGWHVAGMPMDAGMTWGMVLIVGGIGLAAYGLLPKKHQFVDGDLDVHPPEDVPLNAAHWRLMAALVAALVIDVMKPASLGFVVPGLMSEYGVPKAAAALLPFAALIGTVVGSFVWGWLADMYGRRAAMLLSAVMFVGTSICGAMPSFGWNVGMCFMMGAAAGGMLPVTYALLAEAMPARHRGWSLVLVGGLGAAGGYLAASGFSAVLQPLFGWRIMWFLNLPTGLLLIALSAFIPESAKFLLSMGRVAEARAAFARFGAVLTSAATPRLAPAATAPAKGLVGITSALTIGAVAWGLVSFGVLLWLPAELAERGLSAGAAGMLLASSALIAVPAVFLVAFSYSRWSSKWTLFASLAAMALGLAGVFSLAVSGDLTYALIPLSILIVGSNAVIALLMPYAAETYPLAVRGRATGWVAGSSKLGGLLAQAAGFAAIVPPLATASLIVAAPVVASLGLIAWFGHETRGRDIDGGDASALPELLPGDA